MRSPPETPKQTASGKPGKAADGPGRADRLAAALRANLARRKAQKRVREAVGPERPAEDNGQNEA